MKRKTTISDTNNKISKKKNKMQCKSKKKNAKQKRYYLNLADLFFNMVITLKEVNINVENLTYEEVEYYGSMI